jgi:hypothetical protein
MTKLTQERISFIERLHEVFIKKTGHGAFAYISVSDAMSLFDSYLKSNKDVGLYINQYIRSV